jgi:hypothetical protein
MSSLTFVVAGAAGAIGKAADFDAASLLNEALLTTVSTLRFGATSVSNGCGS